MSGGGFHVVVCTHIGEHPAFSFEFVDEYFDGVAVIFAGSVFHSVSHDYKQYIIVNFLIKGVDNGNSEDKVTFTCGVVPVPKYDNTIEKYRTNLGNPYTIYAVNATSKNLEAAGARNIVKTSKVKTYMATEGGVGDWEDDSIARTVNFVEVISRAIGDPPEVQ